MIDELITIEGPGPMNEIGTPKPPRIIDWKRPVRTAHGVEVKIYAIDHNLGKNPVVGGLVGPGGGGSVCSWTYDGMFRHDRTETCLDLENVPETPADAQIIAMSNGEAVSL